MKRVISAADANRRFSELLQKVKTGGTFVVTSQGKPVAKIVPVTAEARIAQAARSALFARLRTERTTNIGRWKRDELYGEAE